MRYELVLFDAGDTLLRAHPSFGHHFAQVCAAHGVHVEGVAVDAALASEMARFTLRVAERSPSGTFSTSLDESHAFWFTLYREVLADLGVACPEGLPEALYGRFSTFDTYRFFDDALPAIATLEEQGYRVGVVSNWEAWLVELLVEHELHHRLAACVVSGAAGIEKPDPAIYRLALDEAGTAPEAAVMVGDSLEADVLGPREVGIDGVLLDRWGRHEGVDVPRITTLADLPGLLVASQR